MQVGQNFTNIFGPPDQNLMWTEKFVTVHEAAHSHHGLYHVTTGSS